MPETRETPLFVSFPQAARELGIGLTRLKRAVELRQVRAIRIGARTMMARASLMKLAEASDEQN